MNFPQEFPVLQVDHYLLRSAEAKDTDAYFKCLTDEDTIHYTSYDVHVPAEITSWFDDYKGLFKTEERISWAIEDTNTGEVIGEISFFNIQLEHDKGEIGYFLNKDYWGHGIMTKLIDEVVTYIFEEIELNRLEAVVVPVNKPSSHILEKIGFQKEGLLRQYKKCRGEFYDFEVYSKLAEE